VFVRRLGPDDWRTWRAVRLESLAEAPYAFGSTLAREREFDEARWRARLIPGNGMAAVAESESAAVGAIGAYTPEETGQVLLVAAWVAPVARGRGVGDALVAEVLDWAREHGHGRVELRVADGNTAARHLFLRNGFVPTGQREPLESDPTVGTEYLVRTVR
jgi:GNAT superfamily N-acetyltransferase